MILWLIAIAVTAVACVALLYAAGPRTVNASLPELADANSHFRLVLAGIDADVAAGKLGEAEAEAARGELAREIIRHQGDKPSTGKALSQTMLVAGVGLVAVVSLGVYGLLGSPDMPSLPLAGRPEMQAEPINLEDAIARIETALTANPNDLRGWTVIAPAYVELGRFGDAANAYRRVIELSEPTADLQTGLAEALLLDANGAGSPEAMALLRAAADSDPAHAMSRLYLAAELTSQENYGEAIPYWEAAIALAKGNEPWLTAAQQGLDAAQNGGTPSAADPQETEMVRQMVSGLAARLASDGGSVEEWTRLVRAYLVMGDTASAQTAYDDAVRAYPKTFDRGELDTLALSAGLKLNGGTP